MRFTKRRLVGGLVVGLGLLAFAATRPEAPVLEPAVQAQPPTTVEGIDVSSYQGTINWTSVKNAGKYFAFVKATEGTTYTDAKFNSNWQNCGYNRIVRGAYHFGHPSIDPYAQVDHFISVAHPKTGDLQLTLDLEVSDGLNATAVWNWTKTFCIYLHQKTGRPGIIYTGYYFWKDNVGNPTHNMNMPLWIAAWGTSNPLIPPAWSTWSFWQYSDTGTVPGISGYVDLDRWNGGLTNLRHLCLP